MRTMPPAVRTLLIANIVVFMLQGATGDSMIYNFALWPLQGNFLPWQLITYAFLHGSLMHIAFNMYGLWMFGSEVEYVIGQRRFMILYFASVFAAGLMQLFVNNLTGGNFPTVGASGGVFGLLLVYAMFFPNRTIILLIPPIPLPARMFVLLYAILELTLGVTGTQAGVAHFAHLGGMIGTWIVIRRWYSRRR